MEHNEYIFIYVLWNILHNPQYFKRLIIQFKTTYILKKRFVLIFLIIKQWIWFFELIIRIIKFKLLQKIHHLITYSNSILFKKWIKMTNLKIVSIKNNNNNKKGNTYRPQYILTPEVKVNIDLVFVHQKKSSKLFCTFAKNTMSSYSCFFHFFLI